MQKDYSAHVSGKLTSKVGKQIQNVLITCNGFYDTATDKGVIFTFTTETERNTFVRIVSTIDKKVFVENSN